LTVYIVANRFMNSWIFQQCCADIPQNCSIFCWNKFN